MKHTTLGRPRLAVLSILFLWCLPGIFGQSQVSDVGCFPSSAAGGVVPATAFFNFGNTNKMKNSTRRMKLTIGQAAVGFMSGDDFNTNFGFWSGLNVAPLPPVVTATQGELADRIQISWSTNPLGAFPTNGFNIYRDGVFLASVAKNIRNYNDFDIIAGRNYTYTVHGINLYGEGSAGSALGFQVPNGVATGWVRTTNGNAVPNALVTLSPMQGFSAKFGQFDGAIARADAGDNFFPTVAGTDWTLSFWLKNNTFPGTVDIMRINGQHLAVRSGNSGLLTIEIPGATIGSIQSLGALLPTGNDGSWHHLALTFGSGQYRLYLDGTLSDLKTGVHIPSSSELYIGANTPFTGWAGGLDELRIYHRRLDELDLVEVMAGTASSLTPNLKYYWKMDEGAGKKSFDILNRHPLFFCGAVFDASRPAVATSGVTDSDGYYRIEGANYGTGTTFIATPKKNFYKHRSLKFLKNEGDRAALPDFGLTEKSTLEMWVNQSEASGSEVLLHKSWGAGGSQFFVLQSLNGTLRLHLNGATHDFGTLGFGYQHLALTIARTPAATAISVFKNGNLLGSHSFAATTGDWSEPGYGWNVGAVSGQLGISAGQFGLFFGGLVDELAVYDTIWSQTKILEHTQNSRDAQERGLRIYFAMDEGTGNKLSNSGSALVDGFGTTSGTEWTVFAPNQETTPHVFAPGTRQVTLNPSVTSVDQVDFTDRSTVAVSGFVRYKDTDCFAEQVEILVNGETYNPIVLTDTTGKFVIDLEPGTSVTLRPRFKNHEFLPAEITVPNVVAPVAGIVFNDIATRTISGQVAGGECKKSIISDPNSPTGTVCRLQVRSLDGCFEKTLQVGNTAGNYTFEDLPPLEMTVAVIEHSDPIIAPALTTQGGVQLDLSEKTDTVVNFIYYAPPTVELSGLSPYSQDCDLVVLEQHSIKTINIKVKEVYYNDEVCYLDTAAIKLVNGFEDSVRLLTLKSFAGINYTFKVGRPIGSPPFLKTLQVVATNLSGQVTDLVVQGLVTGINQKHNTFTTLLPEVPSLVLHDPPGDGSYSFFEENQKTCQDVQVTLEHMTGGGGGLTVHLGASTELIVAPLGFGGLFTIDIENTIAANTQFSYQKVNENTFQTCVSFSKRIATGDNDLIVGDQGGDVFVGTGLNVEFGFADLVGLDTANCTGKISSVVNVEPGDFRTNFVYSEWGIRENVIRFLDSLRVDAQTSPTDSVRYAQSIALWRKVLEDNQHYKDTVTARENISFDAGAVYEYSTTSEVNESAQTTDIFTSEGGLDLDFGFEAFGSGFSSNINFKYSVSKGKTTGTNEETGITTGYVLADDDILDAFSVDVGIDPRYQTAIFRTKSGQSSCPWEPNTAHREGNSMQFRDGSGPVANNVPPDKPATFLFTLGNNSETNETWTYALTAGPESNPHGAKIYVGGAPLDQPLFYAVPWGTSIPITVTLERGPIEYDYDSLEVVFYSLCEDIRANALGILPDDDKILYSAQYISAHFIRPCSEVNINVPEQNWAITSDPLSNDIMRITASGYDRSNAELELIRVQYRRADGDGAWINIPKPATGGNPDQDNTGSIVRDSLGTIFTQFYWDTDGLDDGDYELRAIAKCLTKPADEYGYSQIIRGRIDRQPPSLIGVPQPSDGVFNVGDEISFSFNKDINCQKINALDNVLLFDATTDLPVNIDISCKDNEIFIDPRFDNNSFFENKIFRAELHDIEDLVGNVSANPIQAAFLSKFGWEFYVDRNELGWLTDSVGMTKFEDQSRSVTASVHNRGGYPVPFEVLDVPSWVRVVPNTGTLAPNEVRPIRFEVDSSLAVGHWSDSVTLRTVTGQNPFFMGGDERLPFGVRVVCRPPAWELDAGLFENSMNMVLRLDIGGQFSTDVEDMVAAYVGDTLVGRAHVEFAPQVNQYLAYLTIYGNPHHAGQPLRLEIWDASACLRFTVQQAGFLLQPDLVVGSPGAPQVVNATNFVLREVPLGFGWNWLSFNLAFPDPALNPALASLKHPAGDLLKSQSSFAVYNSNSWLGTLATLDNKRMYTYRANQPDTLKMLGTVLDPATTPIPVVAGWNWVGYVPNYSLPINDALASLSPAPGDLIKSQSSFAQYLSTAHGWVGNLRFMAPPQGYQIKLSAPGTLTYPPPPPNRPAAPAAADRGGQPFWAVDPSLFEHSSTLVGALLEGGANATLAGMELGAFAAGERRGAARAVQVPGTGEHLFFLTVHANTAGEQLRFKLFDGAAGTVRDLREAAAFAPDQHRGSIGDPVPFTLGTSGAGGPAAAALPFEVSPNPFHSETVFRFALPDAQEVVLTVLDAAGRTVSEERFAAHGGPNARTWKAGPADGARLQAGVYFVRLQARDGSTTRKMVVH